MAYKGHLRQPPQSYILTNIQRFKSKRGPEGSFRRETALRTYNARTHILTKSQIFQKKAYKGQLYLLPLPPRRHIPSYLAYPPPHDTSYFRFPEYLV